MFSSRNFRKGFPHSLFPIARSKVFAVSNWKNFVFPSSLNCKLFVNDLLSVKFLTMSGRLKIKKEGSWELEPDSPVWEREVLALRPLAIRVLLRPCVSSKCNSKVQFLPWALHFKTFSKLRA